MGEGGVVMGGKRGWRTWRALADAIATAFIRFSADDSSNDLLKQQSLHRF